FVGAMRGQFLYHAGRNLESVEQFNTTLGMEPRFWIGQICAAKVYEKLGMYSEALAACDLAGQFSGGNSEALSIAGYVHAVSGDRGTGGLREVVEQCLSQPSVRLLFVSGNRARKASSESERFSSPQERRTQGRKSLP